MALVVEAQPTAVPLPAPQSEAVVWSSPLTECTQKVPAEKPEMASDVVVAAPPLETVNWLLFPTVSNWLGLVVPMPTSPSALTIRRDKALEEATWNGSSVLLACTLKAIVGEVTLTPATVPLSSRIPAAVVEAPV